MTHPDDAKDLAIHFSIERLIQVYQMRGKSREDVIAGMCSGDSIYQHGYDAICEQHSITRAELNTRITAFIESEREEERERAAIRSACQLEGEGVS